MAGAYSTGFDAHTHLDDPAFDGDRAEVCARARAAGVTDFAIAGADPAHWDRVVRVAAEIGAVATLGLHPWWAGDLSETAIDGIVARLAGALGSTGLGECGLDHHRARDEGARARQRHALRAQLALARERDVPVILHCVRAHGALLAILRADGIPAAGGFVHAWAGPPDLVQPFLALGLDLSFGSLVARPGAKRARASVVRVPADRLLLETDAPDQPLPGRTRGEPADVVAIATEAATLRGEDPRALLGLAGDNARRQWGRP